jgi:hypothetical protein
MPRWNGVIVGAVVAALGAANGLYRTSHTHRLSLNRT